MALWQLVGRRFYTLEGCCNSEVFDKIFLNFAFCQNFNFDVSGVLSNFFPREGYVSATRDIVTTTRRIADAIRATPGVAVIGRQSFFSVFFSRSMIRIT